MAIQLNNDFLLIVYQIVAKNIALQKTSYLYGWFAFQRFAFQRQKI